MLATVGKCAKLFNDSGIRFVLRLLIPTRMTPVTTKVPCRYFFYSRHSLFQRYQELPKKFSGRLGIPQLNKSKLNESGPENWDSVKSFISSKRITVEKKDYYKILGIEKHSTQQNIKEAYYNLAKIYHPDSHKNSTTYDHQKFQDISEAYEVLNDELKRAEYDKYGFVKTSRILSAPKEVVNSFLSPPRKERVFRPSPNTLAHEVAVVLPQRLVPLKPIEATDIDTNNFKEIPEDIFVPLSFIQAIRGGAKEINITNKSPCKVCRGLPDPRTRSTICHHCKGTGIHSEKNANYVRNIPCPHCNGTRYSLKNMCSHCEGKGITIQKCRLTIQVPMGVNDGDIMKVAIPNKRRMIQLKFRVDSNSYFQRNGSDIHTEAEVSFTQALLGSSVQIRGINGECTLKIPPGTESFTKIKLPGKGIKKQNSTDHGDHIVTIIVKMPKKLTARQRALISAFMETDKDYDSERLNSKPTDDKQSNNYKQVPTVKRPNSASGNYMAPSAINESTDVGLSKKLCWNKGG